MLKDIHDRWLSWTNKEKGVKGSYTCPHPFHYADYSSTKSYSLSDPSKIIDENFMFDNELSDVIDSLFPHFKEKEREH